MTSQLTKHTPEEWLDYSKGYKQASQDIEKGKNLRKRMFEFGYNQAIDDFETILRNKIDSGKEAYCRYELLEMFQELQELKTKELKPFQVFNDNVDSQNSPHYSKSQETAPKERKC